MFDVMEIGLIYQNLLIDFSYFPFKKLSEEENQKIIKMIHALIFWFMLTTEKLVRIKKRWRIFKHSQS